MRAVTLGRPRLHLRETDSTNDRARELARGGRAARHAGDGGDAVGRPRAPGADLVGAARPRAADVARPARPAPAAAARRRRRGGRGGGRRARGSSGPTTCCVDGPQGRRHPGRGPPAGGLGGARHRRQRRGAARTTSRPSCARPPARSGLEPADVEPFLARLLAALERGWRAAGAVLEAWRARDALRGRAVALGRRRGTRRRHRRGGRLLVRARDGGAHGAGRRRGPPAALSAGHSARSGGFVVSSGGRRSGSCGARPRPRASALRAADWAAGSRGTDPGRPRGLGLGLARRRLAARAPRRDLGAASAPGSPRRRPRGGVGAVLVVP